MRCVAVLWALLVYLSAPSLLSAEPTPVYVLWICKSHGWEHDYMMELFPGSWHNDAKSRVVTRPTYSNPGLYPPEFHYIQIDIDDFIALNASSGSSVGGQRIKPRVLVYNVENAGPEAKYEVVRDLMAQFRITVLVHLSDEFQGWFKKWRYGEGISIQSDVCTLYRQKIKCVLKPHCESVTETQFIIKPALSQS